MSISQNEILYNKFKIGGAMRIKDLREDRDLTQRQIADLLNVKQNTYSQYENEQRQIPISALIKLARFYGTSTDYILGLTDEIKPYKQRK